VPFRGQRTWYGVAGDHEAPGKLPLLVVHGGPGVPRDHLEPLAELARDGRRGPSEFHCTGTLRDWDVRPRLGGIAAPALVLGGRHDERTPAIQGSLGDRLPRSEWVVFERSSHVPHLEEPEALRAALLGFRERVEAGSS